MTDDERQELETLRHLAVLTVKPGDVLVIQAPRRLPDTALREYVRALEELGTALGLPSDTTCLVMGEGATLGVVRKDDASCR